MKNARLKEVYISIGSNTPEKDTILAHTVERLARDFTGFICSEIYQTPCWRGDGADYKNAVAHFTTDKTAEELNAIFKAMEADAGRVNTPQCRNIVPLDIDVVIYDSNILKVRDFERNYFRLGYDMLSDPRNISIDGYIYDLPEEKIAAHPLADRDKCRLLVCENDGTLIDTQFDSIGRYLSSDTLLIYNDTRVINARLRFMKPSGAVIEIFCLEPDEPKDYQLNFAHKSPVRWKCLVGNSKRWKSGVLTEILDINGVKVVLSAERISNDGKDSVVRFSWDAENLSFSEIISCAGEIPIPPYLNRNTEESDETDYQTVYGKIEGSVAAPTAGLHFTEDLLAQLRETGIGTRSVTLHVGAGTFKPVQSDSIGGHDMHAELIDVPRSLIAELAETKRPVTAVGTTSVRTLESLYHIGCKIHSGHWDGILDQWYPYSADHPKLSVSESLRTLADFLRDSNCERLIASTKIIIAPGYKYRVVDNLITNFHQPGSTLLLLVSAIVGDSWREIYRHALDNDYRFLSYGDACLFIGLKKIID